MYCLSKTSQRLRELMSDGGLTAEAVAKEMNVSAFSVRAWLRGELLPSLSHAIGLADLFGCSLDFLAGAEKDEPVPPRPLSPFYEQVRNVMKKQGVTRYRVTRDTAVKDSYFTNWSKGKAPKLATACVLAEYLNVSLDFLTGRTDY